MKNFFDIFFAALLLLLLLPIFLFIGLLIRLTSRGPVFFTQLRIGKRQNLFRIYKFRTMRLPNHSFNCDGSEMSNSERITFVGKYLRITSLDELPQLFNIIQGSMSFVGPRPMLPFQLDRLSTIQKLRFSVTPGVTGLAQINGRNSIPWSIKIKYDLFYVRHQSFLLDLFIIIKTFLVVLSVSGNNFTLYDKYSLHNRSTLDDVIN